MLRQANIAVTLIDACGSDLSVVNAARVSFDKESDWDWDSNESETGLAVRDAKLIRYLAKHKHTSPFNHCFASFRVEAPIFVARQLVKHKFLPWNEVSRRYVDSEPEFYIPESWRAKADNVKQGSGEVMGKLSPTFTAMADMIAWRALETYQKMIDLGVCPEQARMVLPLCSMTEWIWSGTLGAWADMCRLRLDPHAQEESRDVAKLISEEMKRLYPVSWEALLNND